MIEDPGSGIAIKDQGSGPTRAGLFLKRGQPPFFAKKGDSRPAGCLGTELDCGVCVPRHNRVSPDGFVQHVLNRGDHRETIFHKPADFRAFLAILRETASRVAMRILAYCIMRNHFHLVLWPYEGADLPVFMQLLMNLHISRYLRHYPPLSPGHIYQARYTNVLVQTDDSFYRLVRYVEGNAKSAGIVQRAEHYKWSSVSAFPTEPERPTIADWPLPKPTNWRELVNEPLAFPDLQRVRRSCRRGSPYGSDEWVQKVAKQYDLEYTLRPRGRPRVYESDVLDEEDISQK